MQNQKREVGQQMDLNIEAKLESKPHSLKPNERPLQKDRQKYRQSAQFTKNNGPIFSKKQAEVT